MHRDIAAFLSYLVSTPSPVAIRPLILLLAVALSGLQRKAAATAAACSPPVHRRAARQTHRYRWDEFTVRFEAVEEARSGRRFGGFVTNVEFRAALWSDRACST